MSEAGHDALLEGLAFLAKVERNKRRHLEAVARILCLRSCEDDADNGAPAVARPTRAEWLAARQEEAAADAEAARLEAEMAHRVAGAVRADRPRSRRWKGGCLQHGATYLVR